LFVIPSAFTLDDRLQQGKSKLKEFSNIVDSDLDFYSTFLPALAYKLRAKTDFYFLTRGVNFAVADEGVLKLKEIACVYAEGMLLAN